MCVWAVAGGAEPEVEVQVARYSVLVTAENNRAVSSARGLRGGSTMRSTPGGGLRLRRGRGSLVAALVCRRAAPRTRTAGRHRRRRRRPHHSRPRHGRRPRFDRTYLCRACRRRRRGAEARPHVDVVCSELEEIALLQAAGSGRGAASASDGA